MGSAESDAGSQFAARFYIESLRANEQRSLRFVSICGEIGAVRWLSYLEADLWRISSGLTCDFDRKSASDTDKETLRACRGQLETVLAVSLPVGQKKFPATQAKRADGADAPSAVWAGQSVTPEVAASLRRLQA
jgi:hypothetical protein